jgi:hypothetical protein
LGIHFGKCLIGWKLAFGWGGLVSIGSNGQAGHGIADQFLMAIEAVPGLPKNLQP